jgi:subtilisin family serine protease
MRGVTARRRRRALVVLAAPAMLLAATTTAGASPPTDPPGAPPGGLSEVPDGIELGERITAPKAPTSAIAQTDPALLGRTDSEPLNVLVKLDYDSVATYTGTIAGLAPTSPAVTGRELTARSTAERQYERFIESQEASFQAELAEVVPEARVGRSLRTVYGGMALTVPANRIDELLTIPGVVAVQEDELLQPLTDESIGFIGADALDAPLGGDRRAGSGVIVGILDTGVWPEHPSFADQGHMQPPPRTFDGRPRTCDFGDNPLTPEHDPFVCNNKLIGGAAFLDTYLSRPGLPPEPFHTARDSNGHGTHTASTAAGNVLDSAEVFGVERGPLRGVAPGAWVSIYKVCGIEGCFESDSAAAVGQAILDGVDVINFSISGGTNPATDPVELAFLDAYAAGVFVATSAGNDGPGASTANHLSPWTTTVAASTQTREFQSTLTVTAPDGSSARFVGASITGGVTTPLPIVLSSAAPYNDELCLSPAPPGIFTGKIVACERGVNARVEKGFNVLQGGAAGMVLYNPSLADVETDNHWLPTVHLADGTDLEAFLQAHPDATASFTAGQKADGHGDVMAAFSSRGPAGHFIKPDVTAPGVQILAGHTPVPTMEGIVGGPDGQLFQAIAGTSMSSPHVAGSAALLAALHPDWTPGQIKSALMTTATTAVVKEDLTTPADPFDAGAGRIRVDVAANPGVTFDARASEMIALATDPVNAVHLNLPSINAPVMPGRLTTTRVATNVSSRRLVYEVQTSAPPGTTIEVAQRHLNVGPQQSGELDVTITAEGVEGQQFGEIRLVPRQPGFPTLHIPVAFVPTQGSVRLTSDCDPDTIARGTQTRCTVIATNVGATDTEVDVTTTVDNRLRILEVIGDARLVSGRVQAHAALNAALPGVPSVEPGELAGYVPLDAFESTLTIPVGDEEIVNLNVPPFEFNGRTYSVVGVDVNGYLVVGGGTAEDNVCCTLPTGPDPARPNNVLAPFWTDLDGTGAPGILANVLSDGLDAWLVVEWRVNVWGSDDLRTFQVWIGLTGDANPEQDITFAYATTPQADPAGQEFLVGAENELGDGDMTAVLPTEDLRVTSTEPTPGGEVSYVVVARGERAGEGVVTTELFSPDVPGITVQRSTVEVTRR